MMNPYIGVSCFTTPEQIRAAIWCIPSPTPRHSLMVGLSMSYKSLRRLPLKEKWQKRMIDLDDLTSLLLPDPRLLNLVHYASDSPGSLADDLLLITNRGNEYLHGFQLNIVWPPIRVIETIRRKCRDDSVIILNLYPPNLAAVDNDPIKLSQKLSEYVPFLDGVLLDSSGGQGNALDPHKALDYMSALYDTRLAIGIAGGLTPNNLELLEPVVPFSYHLSIDAESGLRNDQNELDLDKVKLYLERAFVLLDG